MLTIHLSTRHVFSRRELSGRADPSEDNGSCAMTTMVMLHERESRKHQRSGPNKRGSCSSPSSFHLPYIQSLLRSLIHHCFFECRRIVPALLTTARRWNPFAREQLSHDHSRRSSPTNWCPAIWLRARLCPPIWVLTMSLSSASSLPVRHLSRVAFTFG